MLRMTTPGVRFGGESTSPYGLPQQSKVGDSRNVRVALVKSLQAIVGVRTSVYAYLRCDVPFGVDGIIPEKCHVVDDRMSTNDTAFEENLK